MEKYSYRKFRFIMSIDIFYATLVSKNIFVFLAIYDLHLSKNFYHSTRLGETI